MKKEMRSMYVSPKVEVIYVEVESLLASSTEQNPQGEDNSPYWEEEAF